MDDWWAQAVCAELPADTADAMFFSTARGPLLDQARALCQDCPVRQVCLTTAMAEEAGEPLYHRYGVRGGLTVRERHGLQRTRHCVTCGTPSPTAAYCPTHRAERAAARRGVA